MGAILGLDLAVVPILGLNLAVARPYRRRDSLHPFFRRCVESSVSPVIP
jgi:hypothetical protein